MSENSVGIYQLPTQRRITTSDIRKTKGHEKWVMVGVYDALLAELLDEAQIPVLLVGDSAANVVYGYDTTVPISMEEMLPLVGAVVRGSKRALVVADMPFGSYQLSPTQALENAIKFVKTCGAHAVKMEGGLRNISAVKLLTETGIPVMGHLGLTPQSVHQMGGYKVQGRGAAAEQLVEEAKALEAAGAFAIVLEVMPNETARLITEAINIPTIGIGAGPNTDAHVMIWQDLFGMSSKKPAKFVKQYANLRNVFLDGFKNFASDVRDGSYPGEEHNYSE